MIEISELKDRIEALEVALNAALRAQPDAVNIARQALQSELDEIAKKDSPPRQSGFQRVIEMQPKRPGQEGRKAALATLLKQLS